MIVQNLLDVNASHVMVLQVIGQCHRTLYPSLFPLRRGRVSAQQTGKGRKKAESKVNAQLEETPKGSLRANNNFGLWCVVQVNHSMKRYA